MKSEILEYLRCPSCRRELDYRTGTLHCPKGHSFDQARQGHVDLTNGGITHSGDSAEMVTARAEILAKGYLSVVGQSLHKALTTYLPNDAEGNRKGFIVDIGAGTGHHLGQTLDIYPAMVGLAVDISKAALRKAARAHPRLCAIRADIWRGLPIIDNAADVVLNVFAPRSAHEFHRILKSDGILIVVTPSPCHLTELVHRLKLIQVDPHKQQRLIAQLEPFFRLSVQWRENNQLSLTPPDALMMIKMGPNSWHHEMTALAHKLESIPSPMTVTTSIDIGIWKPHSTMHSTEPLRM